MPAILERLVRQLRSKGHDNASAHAIAVSTLQKSGNLKPGTQEATKQGDFRGKLSPRTRERDRFSGKGLAKNAQQLRSHIGRGGRGS